MPFCGRVSVPNIVKLLRTAVKNGTACDKNRRVTVTGAFKEYDSVVKPFMLLKGLVAFDYYDTRILTVDFINHRMTDHGMSSYSSDTRKTLDGYLAALSKVFKFGIPKSIKYSFAQWTGFPRPKTAQYRFMKRAPWVYVSQHGNIWLRWNHYDAALADAYNQGQYFIRNDQNWRWFEYDWDENGTWARKFIDAGAERRYRQREKKCRRTSKTTKSTSSGFSLPGATPLLLTLPSMNITPSAYPPGMGAPLSTLG